jgi:tripartite-type tricarboxylate transporter receptor subunit TctC
VVEAGFPDLIIQDWMGLVVKRGTPDAFATRLNAAVNKALSTAKVREAIIKLAAAVGGGSRAEFGTYISSQLSYWASVVKDSGIRVE